MLRGGSCCSRYAFCTSHSFSACLQREHKEYQMEGYLEEVSSEKQSREDGQKQVDLDYDGDSEDFSFDLFPISMDRYPRLLSPMTILEGEYLPDSTNSADTGSPDSTP